jgi:hypothetical protein
MLQAKTRSAAAGGLGLDLDRELVVASLGLDQGPQLGIGLDREHLPSGQGPGDPVAEITGAGAEIDDGLFTSKRQPFDHLLRSLPGISGPGLVAQGQFQELNVR